MKNEGETLALTEVPSTFHNTKRSPSSRSSRLEGDGDDLDPRFARIKVLWAFEEVF